MPIRERIALRENFLKQIPSIESFQQLFNQLPGVYFCVKDLRSRLIWGNEALFRRLNMSEDKMPGTVDQEYFPAHVAESFIADDQRVLATGKPLINRVAVWYSEQRILDWFVKCKFPLRNQAGRIVGLIVCIQNYEGMHDAQTPYSELNRAIDYIRKNSRERISVARLASISGVSPRHLHRRFHEAFRLSAQEFLMKTRIQATVDALIRTNMSISEIATDFGFCDQSAFTKQFRKHTGYTPRKFRQLHAIKPAGL